MKAATVLIDHPGTGTFMINMIWTALDLSPQT